MSNPPDVILRHLIPKPKLPFIHQLPNFHLQTKTSIVYTPFHGDRIFFIWSLGFGILKQNGAEIRDWISMHTKRDAGNTHHNYRIEQNFWVRVTGFKSPIGDPRHHYMSITVMGSLQKCSTFLCHFYSLWECTVTLNRRFQKHFLHSCSFKTRKKISIAHQMTISIIFIVYILTDNTVAPVQSAPTYSTYIVNNSLV